MNHPLLSVVIPTHRRAIFLTRAIESALKAAPDGDVEVIVVPNGVDASWRSVAEDYKKEVRVRWSPIELAHANAARNHGMSLAKGEYIRFLDDDDYFYPEMASKQLVKLIEIDADLSFGDIKAVDEECDSDVIFKQLDTDDYYAAVLSPTHSTAVNALVYKRELTKNLFWDVSVNKNQDVYWAMQLCKFREMRTIRFEGVVAAWVQHNLPRISQGHHPDNFSKETVNHIFGLINKLSEKNALSEPRRKAAADHLWTCIHRAIIYDPVYWIGVANIAEKIHSESRPNTLIQNHPIFKKIGTKKIEILCLPWRFLKLIVKRV